MRQTLWVVIIMISVRSMGIWLLLQSQTMRHMSQLSSNLIALIVRLSPRLVRCVVSLHPTIIIPRHYKALSGFPTLAIEIWTVARCGVEGESEVFLRQCNTVSYLVKTNPKLEFIKAQVSCGSKSRTVSMTSHHEPRITSFWKWKAMTLFFRPIELGIDRV